MRFFRVILRGLRRAATKAVASTALELAAMVLVVLLIFHFLGLWWAIVPTAIFLVLIALALDRGRP
jgi:hypothetical protein